MCIYGEKYYRQYLWISWQSSFIISYLCVWLYCVPSCETGSLLLSSFSQSQTQLLLLYQQWKLGHNFSHPSGKSMPSVINPTYSCDCGEAVSIQYTMQHDRLQQRPFRFTQFCKWFTHLSRKSPFFYNYFYKIMVLSLQYNP